MYVQKVIKPKIVFPMLSLFLIVLLVNPVIASTYTISPKTCLVGIPTDFKIKGLTSGTRYTVYVDNTLELNDTADSDGCLVLTYTFDEAGSHTIDVKDSAGTSSVASFKIVAYDLLNMIVPYLVLILSFFFLMGIVDVLDVRKLFRTR